MQIFFISNYTDNLCICSSVQTTKSAAFSKVSKQLFSSIQVPLESKNRCSLSDVSNSPTIQKDVLYFSQQAEFSRDECFGGIIQSKVHKLYSFHHFYFHRKTFLKDKKAYFKHKYA